MEDQMCFECLQNRIQTDFSDKLIFNYGISNSTLPFGNTAVVQLANTGGEVVSPQFTLVYIPRSGNNCFVKYINEHIQEDLDADCNYGENRTNLSIIHQDNAALCSERSEFDIKSHASQCFSDGGGKTSFCWLGCDPLTCKFSDRFSCLRTITALAPVAQIGISSYPTFINLASNFLSGLLEDHILCSLCVLIEGKATGRDCVNFLNLLGLPSFNEDSSPGCVRHPNIVPILGMLTSASHVNFVLPKSPYTLENILHYSPSALKSDWHIRFLLYQLLSALTHLHGLGITHGSMCPSNVLLSDLCWCWLHVGYAQPLSSNIKSKSEEFSIIPSVDIGCCTEGCRSQELYADLKLSQSIDWHSSFSCWWRGDLSNFEYLLVLNKLAGRRWGDHTFHTVMPWVIDFSVKPDEICGVGWRDLRKSKWRLAKGDEQLDFTYSTSEIPHHVSDECLSELAVCSYKARRLPLSVLRMAVRSVYEPNEYPSTMQRLFQWTPDECIPEFYSDPLIFESLHSGMSDLAVPSWSGTAEEFINLHRDALESDKVSGEIHHWIDITFGYKMSGESAVAAKNVMLPASAPTTLRSAGRRQLFTEPHPTRQCSSRWTHKSVTKSAMGQLEANEVLDEKHYLETSRLKELEETYAFCEHARHLSPIYILRPRHRAKNDSSVEEFPPESSDKKISRTPDSVNIYRTPTLIDLNHLLESVEVDDESFMGYQELLLWKQNLSSYIFPEIGKMDMFSIGCILAELYLGKPLFDPKSLGIYLESGILPKLIKGLPPHAEVVVEACIQKESWRRPSAKSLLESPYFPATVRSAYLYLSPLQLLSSTGSRIRYAATFAKQGALTAMGAFAAEMCVPHCLSLIAAPLSDSEAEWACTLLKEFLRCLNPVALGTLILPAIQKILQATGYSHLKVSILQDSFVQELWKRIGKQKYLEKIHPMVLSNLYVVPHKSTAAAASVLLVGSSEELGLPITVNQTILPLIQYFGKGLCSDGIDVVIRIGVLLGENFVVNQVLPLLRNIVSSCIDVSYVNKPEPLQSWGALALMDCLMTLDGLVTILKKEVLVKELIEEGRCMYIQVLMQSNIGMPVLQAAATSLIGVCQQIGSDLTAMQVVPKLRELFSELAFSQEAPASSASFSGRMKDCKTKIDEVQIESRMDLVLLLYPPLASLLGIEKLRQCCATWLILEQFLLRCHNWKWEYTGESSLTGPENINSRRSGLNNSSSSEYSPARKLLNGSGWSIPQCNKDFKVLKPHTRSHDYHHNPVDNPLISSNVEKHEPWYWFPSPASSWDGPNFLSRVGGSKDELPWKIKASVIHSVRAHHGALGCFAVQQDECKVFTAGVGQGFKGTIQKWDLSRIDCLPGYHGHEEVVNGMCVLASSERVASCDGTVHIWNSQTGKLISVFAEFSEDSMHHVSPLTSASRVNLDHANMLNFNPHLSGIMTTAFDGSLYSSLHYLQNINKIVMGTGNGSLRFIDVVQGQKLHLWRTESTEAKFPSLVSSICSCGSDKMQADGIAASPSWVAAGLSSGKCRLLDVRSGHIIASWQAHDGYITKLAAPEDHLLVSSSLDRTLRIWDLRRNWTTEPTVFRGHNDSVSGFSVWGQDVISISRNKIGLSSLSRPVYEDGQHRVTPQYLYMADRELRNLSVFSSITILPFSRLFLVGTEDGYLKICC